MFKIFKYGVYDILRSRWTLIYFLFYLLSGFVLLNLSGDSSRAMVSLMNIIIILSPLIGTIFGITYYYNAREFVELLLAQPIKRNSIFLGQYLGLAASLSISLVFGLGLPFLLFGVLGSGEEGTFMILLSSGVLLTFIFTGFSFVIAIRNENRIKGFGLAILLWLFLVVVYDGIFLLSLVLFQDYPVEKLALALSLLNPVDLSRVLVILKMDTSALLGYTGAVFNKFFGTNLGVVLSGVVLILWAVIPVVLMNRLVRNKDF